MCAIFGILGRYDPERAGEAFRRLAHRGPDDSWLIFREEGAFGVHRLAIESAGEPMTQPLEADGTLLLFNGEIYNYRELAAELEVEPMESRVLLAAWRRWGDAFVERLRGMYALALYDRQRGWLHLFRDPVGKKPLYYLQEKNFFAFASEAKALYALKPFFLQRRHLVQYLGYQATIAPHTLDWEVRKLEPGEALSVEISFDTQDGGWKMEDGEAFSPPPYSLSGSTFSSFQRRRESTRSTALKPSCSPEPWIPRSSRGMTEPRKNSVGFDIANQAGKRCLKNLPSSIFHPPSQTYDPWLKTPIRYRTETEAAEALEAALKEALSLRIPRKVPWGVLLSGGLDSSLVAAMAARKINEPLRTFSIGYEGYEKYDERPWAERTAKHLGAEHRSYALGKEEFFATLNELLPLLDEPLGDPAAIPLYFLMKKAAGEGIRVLLGGEGSDELFLGYRTYREYFAIEQAKELPYRNWLRNYFRRYYSENKEWEWYKRAWEGEPIFRSSAELYTDLQLARLLRQNVRDGQNLEAIRPWLERFEASARNHPADWYSYLDLKVMLAEVYLARQDRISMATGLEARSPFLDRRVVETAFAIDPALRMETAPKGILKRVATKYLPEKIVGRKKKGLNYPFIEWILEEGGVETIWRVQEETGLFREEQLTFLAERADRGKFRQHLFPLYLLARWLEVQGLTR